MKAIFSLWSKPLLNNHGGFSSPEDLLISLQLASHVAKRHFEHVEFYTDTPGVKFIEEGDFAFTRVHNVLDSLNLYNIHLWGFPKVYVYALQQEPFVHIDNDVFIFGGIPDELLKKDFFFQCPEFLAEPHYGFYNDWLKYHRNELPPGFFIPEFAFNCGIMGCNRVDVLPVYLNAAKYIADGVQARQGKEFTKASALWNATIVLEQLAIASIVVKQKLSFGCIMDYNVKFTHLIAGSKRKHENMQKVKRRVQHKIYT